MPSSCEFNLNKINGVYFSGETIEGTIVLNTTSPKDVRDISILFRVEGRVSWDEKEIKTNSDGTTSTQTITFKSKKSYVDYSSNVHGEGTLQPGSHTSTFSIPLLRPCPTSLEGRHGHIRYELALKLSRPLLVDYIFTKPITVIRPVDLNLIPSYRLPLESEESILTSCWTCLGGKIYYTCRIPCSGYTSGQSLKYSLIIQNQSKSDIDGFSIEFFMKMTFTAYTPQQKTLVENYTLYNKRFNKTCLHSTSRGFEGEYIIPATPPTTDIDGIIAVEYYLKTTIHISELETDTALIMPIFIGTVPFSENVLQTEVTEATDLIEVIQPTVPELPSYDDETENDLPPNYRDLAPPTFAEAMLSNSSFIDTDKDERYRNASFRPLYPMYSQTDE